MHFGLGKIFLAIWNRSQMYWENLPKITSKFLWHVGIRSQIRQWIYLSHILLDTYERSKFYPLEVLIRRFTCIYELKKSTFVYDIIWLTLLVLFLFLITVDLTILTNVFMLSNSMLHTLITYCTHNNLVYLEMSLLSSLGKDSYWFS